MEPFKVLQHLEICYDTMQKATINDEKGFAWYSNIRHPLFNIIMRTNRESLQEMIALAPLEKPMSVWLHDTNIDKDLEEDLCKLGFSYQCTCPLMVWYVSKIAASRAKICVAEEDLFYDITSQVFGFNAELVKQYKEILLRPACKKYLLYADAKPIATGLLIHKGRVGGIFNMAVLPEYQKQGYGKAMMAHLMQRASQLNLDSVVLLSTPEAFPFYKALGFKTALEIRIYVKTSF